MSDTANETDQAGGDADGAYEPENPGAAEAAQEVGFLDKPALLPGEDAEEYAGRLKQLTEQLQPADAIDEKFVRDLAHYEWTSVRYRKMLAALTVVGEQEALERILQRLIGQFDDLMVDDHWKIYPLPAQVLARQYIRKLPEAMEEVERILVEAGLSWASVEAEATSGQMYEIERIDRMMRTADYHCQSVQRELERRRSERIKAVQRAQRATHGAKEPALRKLAA